MIQWTMRFLRRRVAVFCLCLLTTAGFVEHAAAQTDSIALEAQQSAVPKGWHPVSTGIGGFQLAFPDKPSIKKLSTNRFPLEIHLSEGDKGRFLLQLIDISADKRSSRSIESLKRQVADFSGQGFKTIKLAWSKRD